VSIVRPTSGRAGKVIAEQPVRRKQRMRRGR